MMKCTQIRHRNLAARWHNRMAFGSGSDAPDALHFGSALSIESMAARGGKRAARPSIAIDTIGNARHSLQFVAPMSAM